MKYLATVISGLLPQGISTFKIMRIRAIVTSIPCLHKNCTQHPNLNFSEIVVSLM